MSWSLSSVDNRQKAKTVARSAKIVPDSRGTRPGMTAGRSWTLPRIPHPHHHEPRKARIQHAPVRPCQETFRAHRHVFQRYRVIDIAAHHRERTGCDAHHDVAMGGETPSGKIGESKAARAAAE